jgi:hypothetical protein
MKYLLLCLTAALLLTSRAEAYYPLSPNQFRVCLADIDKEKLKLRYYRSVPPMVNTFAAKEVNDKGQPEQFTYSVIHQQYLEQRLSLPVAVVQAFDSEGKKLDPAELPALLGKGKPFMVSSVPPDPEMFKLLKKGTVVLVLPVSLDLDSYSSSPGAGVSVT